jgi:hypothetical protein
MAKGMGQLQHPGAKGGEGATKTNRGQQGQPRAWGPNRDYQAHTKTAQQIGD